MEKEPASITPHQPHRSYFTTTVGCYCPRCREGKLFTFPLTFKLNRVMVMNDNCPVCGQPTQLEVGFYYGTSYVSYVIGIVLSVISLIAWWLIVGFSLSDNRFFYWLFSNSFLLIALQPWLMRFSRSLWLSWFVRYDPDWKNNKPEETERINETQMNNW